MNYRRRCPKGNRQMRRVLNQAANDVCSFKFITPSMPNQYKIPNPCTTCHTSHIPEWAKEQLKNWSGMSPWRVQ